MPASLFGYAVMKPLGEGSGCVIYEGVAGDTQHVALKHLRRTAETAHYVDQADNEALVAARVNHPAVRRILSVRREHSFPTGVGDLMRSRSLRVTGEVCLVMQLIEGSSLAFLSPNNIARACGVFRDVADGLHAIHQAGYVHCEVKPNNLLFTRDGRGVVIDLGMACPIGTARKYIHHTPGFIAPEQAACTAVTPQTDIFSFGATVYRVLSGQSPISARGTNAALTDERAYDRIAPLRDLNPAVPPALATLVMECLGRKPEARPASMEDVRTRLTMAMQQLRNPPAARTPRG